MTTNINLTSSVSQFAADGKEKYKKTCIAWGDLNLKTLLLQFETIRAYVRKYAQAQPFLGLKPNFTSPLRRQLINCPTR